MLPRKQHLTTVTVLLLSLATSARCEEKKTAGPASPPKFTNALAKETSPYLLQHAHNPVDWQAWSEETLAKAKREGKPIFLSIGYSSCHWCHVMERESFLDKEIAELLNKNFICIKVDREERPDVDAIYMTALQVYNRLSGSGRGGGWPLSMFLTPDAEPFFGGTYFPARDGDREGVIGFLTILQRVVEFWKTAPDKIREDAKTLVKFTKAEMEGQRLAPLTPLTEALYTGVQTELADQYDEKYGGFGYDATVWTKPKFPEPSNLVYLLDRVERAKDERAKEMLVTTLEKMSLGGIRDSLGGGFHRYSVDRFWRIPHFEKMLYDNGQLASVYARAYERTGRDDFRRIAEELCDFVLREMTDPETGGFYAALDADSEHEEGKFYRWDKDEVAKLLTPEEFELFALVYGLTRGPNFEEKYYVPQLIAPESKLAADMNMSEVELEKRLAPIRAKLLAARSKRIRPGTDTKILTAENGLMIAGLADAGRIFKNEKYLAAAQRAADFVLAKLRTKDGRLLRTYGGGEAKLNAYLNDYAFLTAGLISLYRATGEKRWLTAADEITAKQIELFADKAGGGFYFTSKDHEALFARAKDPVDGAIPAGNSVSATNLIFLATELNKPELLKIAESTIQSSASLIEVAPTAVPRMAIAIPALLDAKEKLTKREPPRAAAK
jgi:uncharacterized protein YyaL (SSP411 family)